MHRSGLSRGRLTLGGAVLVVVAAVVVAAVGVGGARPAQRPPTIALATTSVTRCTLTRSESVDGQVGFGAARTLPIQATGTITWLPRRGRVVTEGGQLVRVDDRPVVLLYGTLPQYRELDPARGPGALPPHGADVDELAAALTRLGYGPFAAGSGYGAQLVAAVRRWQRDLGEDATGVLRLGDIYVARGPLRVVAADGVQVGDPMSAAALTSTGREPVVTAAVAEAADWAVPGARVRLAFAGGRAVVGRIRSVLPPAAGRGGDPPTTRVVIGATGRGRLPAGSAGPVTVTHVDAQRRGVLCVPVLALLVLADGEYGLQLDGPRPARYVAVRTGLFAQGSVEVSGPNVAAGLRVLMPAAG